MHTHRKKNIVHRVLYWRMIWGHPPPPPQPSVCELYMYSQGQERQRSGSDFEGERGWGDPNHTTAQKFWYYIHYTPFTPSLLSPLSPCVSLDPWTWAITGVTNNRHIYNAGQWFDLYLARCPLCWGVVIYGVFHACECITLLYFVMDTTYLIRFGYSWLHYCNPLNKYLLNLTDLLYFME